MDRHIVASSVVSFLEYRRSFSSIFGLLVVLGCSLQVNAYAQSDKKPLVSEIYKSPSDLSNVAFIPGTSDLAVLEKNTGRVMRVPVNGTPSSVLLDLSSRLKSEVPSEQGLLGIAFQPDFATSKVSYVIYTNKYNQWTLSRLKLSEMIHEEVLFQIDRYASFHACGQIEFHPIDGYLYACLGDSDAQTDPNGTSENLDLLHGKIIRIDVTSSASGYIVPSTNPYARSQSARPEIWVSGLRNPWQFSFNSQTGDAFIPDVGLDSAEEVNFLKYPDGAGSNFGWPRYEGGLQTQFFQPCASGNCVESPDVFPVFSYGRARGCAVIGGAVFVGTEAPEWHGTYFYSDACSRVVSALRFRNGAWQQTELGTLSSPPRAIKSAPDGSIYIVGEFDVSRLNVSHIEDAHWQAHAPTKPPRNLQFKSLRELTQLIENEPTKTVVISVKDEATAGVSPATADALEALGLNFKSLAYRGSYAAVITGGKVISQQVNNAGEVNMESDVLRALGIDSVRSAGWSWGDSSEIVVHGVNLSYKQRGMNLVVLDGDDVQAGYIDTHVGEAVSPAIVDAAVEPPTPAAGSTGSLVFKKCASCHRVGPGAINVFGPVLNGLLGRRAGTYPSYSYSAAAKNSGLVWDEATLAAYLRDPKALVPGTKMLFGGLATAKEIADVIAYLKTFGSHGETINSRPAQRN